MNIDYNQIEFEVKQFANSQYIDEADVRYDPQMLRYVIDLQKAYLVGDQIHTVEKYDVEKDSYRYAKLNLHNICYFLLRSFRERVTAFDHTLHFGWLNSLVVPLAYEYTPIKFETEIRTIEHYYNVYPASETGYRKEYGSKYRMYFARKQQLFDWLTQKPTDNTTRQQNMQQSYEQDYRNPTDLNPFREPF